MNWDRIEGNWKQVKGKIKENWGKLTDDDIDVIAGKRDQLIGKIQKQYGISRDEAEKQVDRFGSGWAWLAERNGRLQVVALPNAGTPIADGATPLLAVDVWEHAYYLDYQNERPKFVTAVFDKLLDWDFVAKQLEKAHKQPRKAA